MAKAAERMVACPKCGRKQRWRSADAIYMCVCRFTFDDSPEEGGDYSDRNPAARLERADEQRIRRQNRTRARMGKR